MQTYLNLAKEILADGTRQSNRTGIDAISLPGAMMKFDLRLGFPAMTTKKLAFKASRGETVGFCKGVRDSAEFKRLGCGFWDANANKDGVDPFGNVVPNKWLTNPNRTGENDLGRIYGVQWRQWRGRLLQRNAYPDDQYTTPVVFKKDSYGTDVYEPPYESSFSYESIDQLQNVIDTIRKDPTNRRIIMNAWRPDEFDQMALPPCHVLYQFLVNVEKNELNLCMYQRSCDMFLGVPMNITSASMILSIVAKLTGYTPAVFTHFLADAHIYVNHLDQINLQLSREPRALPKLMLSDNNWDINTIEPEDIWLDGYDPHPAIPAPMAV